MGLLSEEMPPQLQSWGRRRPDPQSRGLLRDGGLRNIAGMVLDVPSEAETSEYNQLQPAVTEAAKRGDLREALLGKAGTRQLEIMALYAMGMLSFGDIGNIKGKHASPHKFDKFDLSHIGNGEGAQAYGHGGYLAEADQVVDEYFNTFKSRPNQFDYRNVSVDGKSAEDLYSEALARINKGDMSAEAEYNFWEGVLSGQHPEEVVAAFKDSPEDFGEGALEFVKKLEKSDIIAPENLTPRAYRYEVELDAKPEEMLDWDKPLSEQSKAVREAVEDRVEQLRQFAPNYVPKDPDGEWLYKAFGPQGGLDKWDGDTSIPGAASKTLREKGIKGIRYLDGNSRGKGEGTYNYVFFDDKDARILTRDGEPIKGLLSDGAGRAANP